MGDNIYTEYWQSLLPAIIEQFKAGNQTLQLEVKGLSAYGERQSYYANFRIVNSKLEISNNAYAQGRDLHQVLIADEYFKENLSSSTIQITISRDLILKMEILEPTAPDFFTEEDFEQLQKLAGVNKIVGNEVHQQVYDYLRVTYAKTGYWAKQVQKKLFPEGKVHLIQKPTNQANNFEQYHWAKIFPDKQTAVSGLLAYTVTIDTDEQFVIKIDTVGLSEADERRQTYLQIRGEYTRSPIVKILPAEQVLDKGWKYLIDLSANIIASLKPEFNKLLNLLPGTEQNYIINNSFNRPDMALNTILYGPPGTGKTYKLQSLSNGFIVKKAVQTREEFLEALIPELTWWETVAASLMILKEAAVPQIEKHEFIKVKAKQSGTKHVKQILWGSLQGHTDPKFPNVQVANRTEPFIFEKLEDSIWKVHSDEVEKNCPEVLHFLNGVKNFKAETHVEIDNFKMVTFHQNFSYEDFVEGIKPVFGIFETDNLRYEIQEGVFYQCCNEAVRLAGYDSLYKCLSDTREARQLRMKAAPPYALFIDEINRANVSSVLGELITLIEDDKRLGAENEVTNIILPYSKTPFGVPLNLYIIGTMNTADRSVEALDTALRRRFVFEEMMPNPALLSRERLVWKLWWDFSKLLWHEEPYKSKESELYRLLGVTESFGHDNKIWDLIKAGKEESQISLFSNMPDTGNGISLEKMLTVMNKRLSALLTKDHTIGHAWFMNVYNLTDLQKAFKQKILPLLQEFFYNDYAKIGLVLGKAFVETKVMEQNFASFDEELAAEFAEKPVYFLKNPLELELKDFKSIYE